MRAATLVLLVTGVVASSCAGSDPADARPGGDAKASAPAADSPKLPVPADVEPSNLKSDEVVRFLPTYARRSGDAWQLPIEAWVYEPEDDSIVRRAGTKVVEKIADIKLDDATSARLVRAMAPFLVDNEGGKRVVMHWGGFAAQVCETESNGRCRGTLSVGVEAAKRATALPGQSTPVVEAELVVSPEESRAFSARVFLLEDAGVSVISDIDDTIKVTGCHDKSELLQNTLLRDPKPAAGVAKLYMRWAEQGAAFHYVSNSPLPLLMAITHFIGDAGYPAGSIALKPFRWKDGTFLELLAPPEDHKQAVLEGMVAPWTARKFVLVGDTGERDPEIYAALARKFPERIAAIYLRNPLPGAPGLDERLTAAFEGLPATLWTVFIDGDEVTDALPKP